MREYNYNIQFIKGKHNYVADHLSRPVQKISKTTEAMWLGLDKEAFQIKQREEPVWEELVSYLEGLKLPTKRLPKTVIIAIIGPPRSSPPFSLGHKLDATKSLL